MTLNYNIFKYLLLLTAFLLVSFSTIRNTASDPRSTLLVSESLLTQRTIKLDHYGEEIIHSYGAAVHLKNGHYYYYFPLGTPLFSIPFVAVAKGWGLNIQQSEAAIQMLIASFTAVLTLVFLIKLAGIFLAPANALLISAVFWFGTSLASTAGTALWSHNFATLFALMAVYAVVKAVEKEGDYDGSLIAFYLFSAYLCRPTMALLAAPVLLFYFAKHKKSAIKSAALLAVLASCFVGFSIHEFNQLLPDYYLPQRLSGEHFIAALYGNLVSPARGLLVYSPFILLAWLCAGTPAKNWPASKTWLLIGLAWPVAHLLVIAKFPYWYARGSFGARFMIDVLPGLFLLTLYAWPRSLDGMRNRIGIGILALASAFAIYVNAYQGLFNPYSVAWNEEPNLEENTQYLFDWKYPQFLHNQTRHEKRLLAHELKKLSPLLPSEILSHSSEKLAFIGWSVSEGTHRWSLGKSARIVFLNKQGSDKFKGELSLTVSSHGQQRIDVFLNKQLIYHGQMDSWWNQPLTIPFPPNLLKVGANTLRFDLPDAQQPKNGDVRALALALISLSVH